MITARRYAAEAEGFLREDAMVGKRGTCPEKKKRKRKGGRRKDQRLDGTKEAS
jgi:hypothetical protein